MKLEIDKTAKYEKSPYYSQVGVLKRIAKSIKCLPTKSFKR